MWNAGRRFQGRTDVPLSEEGRAQAAALSLRLRAERIDAAYASDLVRAYETALAIAAPHGLTPRRDSRLREFDFGAWEGLTWPEIVERWPAMAEHRLTEARAYRPEGGESFEEVVKRARAFVDSVRATETGRVLVVSHAGFLHAFVAVFEDRLGGLDPYGISFSAASLTRVAMDGDGVRLMSLNDVSHLDPTA